MRIVFCWTDISGYMAACWRALAALPDVELLILAYQVGAGERDISFQSSVLDGLKHRLLSPAEIDDATQIESLVEAQRPDVVVIPGWAKPGYRALPRSPRLRGARFVMTMDTPWRGTWRQRIARLKIGGYLRQFSGVVVPGERAWQFARRLGVPEANIFRGLYGIGGDLLGPTLEQRKGGSRSSDGWPRRFLFIGRYVPDKGIDVLLRAYEEYRGRVSDPWPLTCCGQGPYAGQLRTAAGVNDRGFVQPADLPGVLREHGVFVLPSRFDPWPLAIVEACAAGLPVIHSQACGSAVELVRPYYNGIGVATADERTLIAALHWCHEHPELLPQMGHRGQALAGAYSAEAWARRWIEILRSLPEPP